MKPNLLCSIFSPLLLLLIYPHNVNAQDQGNTVILPAGTLLHCTLDEPDFSSQTVGIGTPVVCPLAGLLMFDRMVLPRGAYLGGHLEADKEPGHFFGKGYLKLEFDHIGLPDQQIPVPAHVISATGFKVDKEGKILGHGHATRDTVEWMIPPLWPIKALTLPARGPRPALKGEEPLTLRLMDDVAVPAAPSSVSRTSSSEYFRPDYLPQRNNSTPSRYVAPKNPAPEGSSTADNLQVAAKAASSSDASGTAKTVTLNVLVLQNGVTHSIVASHIDGNRLSYTLSDGGSGAVSLDEIDWTRTFESNAENGTELTVANGNSGR